MYLPNLLANRTTILWSQASYAVGHLPGQLLAPATALLDGLRASNTSTSLP